MWVRLFSPLALPVERLVLTPVSCRLASEASDSTIGKALLLLQRALPPEYCVPVLSWGTSAHISEGKGQPIALTGCFGAAAAVSLYA